MQDKLVKYSKGQQSYIIPSAQEENWKQNFSSVRGNNDDITSYQREEAEFFTVDGQASPSSLSETNETSQHQGGRSSTR